MAIITCPSCQRRYDPGVEEELDDLPGNVSLKVVCPACGQWLRLPEREPIDPPNAPPEVLREMQAQSKLVDGDDAPRAGPRRDADADRPRRRSRDDEGNADDRTRRRRPRDDEDDGDDDYDSYDDRPRRSSRDHDEWDDFDDYPRRKPSDGLGITSMILGIMSCVIALGGLCCIVFSLGSILGGIVAVVLGFVAKSEPAIEHSQDGHHYGLHRYRSHHCLVHYRLRDWICRGS